MPKHPWLKTEPIHVSENALFVSDLLNIIISLHAGVFLHVLADTLGSVGVIISAILIHQFGKVSFNDLDLSIKMCAIQLLLPMYCLLCVQWKLCQFLKSSIFQTSQ